MKLTVKLDFGCGKELKVGTFSEIGRDTAFEFAGEFLSSGLECLRVCPRKDVQHGVCPHVNTDASPGKYHVRVIIM